MPKHNTPHGPVVVTEIGGATDAESVFWKDANGRAHHVGALKRTGQGQWVALVEGLGQRDDPPPYDRRHDALTFMAGVGKERHG